MNSVDSGNVSTRIYQYYNEQVEIALFHFENKMLR